MSAFTSFREELDDYNDRREALVKLSRDITNLSKKCIFLLHRLVVDPSLSSSSSNADEERVTRAEAARKGYEALGDVKRLFEGVGALVEDGQFWRYQRAVSPGLQEFIEAYSFAYYLEHSTLVSYAAIQDYLSSPSGEPYFPLPESDYLLGLSDLTGELMRFAISSIAMRGGRSKARELCTFVRGCRAGFEAFTPSVKGLSEKQKQTTQSLKKIEDAAYAISIREREYAASPEALEERVSQYVAGFGLDRGYDGPPNGRTRDADDEGDED